MTDRWTVYRPGAVLTEEDPLGQRPHIKDEVRNTMRIFPTCSYEAAVEYVAFLNNTGFPEVE